jgi:hypothetical protein
MFYLFILFYYGKKKSSVRRFPKIIYILGYEICVVFLFDIIIYFCLHLKCAKNIQV